ncbi:MAG: WG repeat-containing protein [Bacteroidales bacterium]|nr:WG repeat-containing protein [Bacteroidales bacterium]
MKRYSILLLFFTLLATDVFAQKLVQDPNNKLYGYKNSDGGWQIAPQFGDAHPFQGRFKRFAVVKLDRHWGCCDDRGQMVVRNIFATHEEAEAAGREWEKGDEPGKWLYATVNPATGLWGFVNYYGDWKYAPVYEDARQYVGKDPMSFATVKTGGRWGCIDGKGVMIIQPIFMEQQHADMAGKQWIAGTNYDTWLYPTQDKETGLWGHVNYLGRWVIGPEYEDHDYFGPDHNYFYCQMKKNGRWGTIDRQGNVASHFIFFTKADAHYALNQIEHQRPLTGWRLPVTDPQTDRWGWVDPSGEWVIEPMYEGASHFANDTGRFATAKLNGKWASIADNGELLSKNVFTLSGDAWKAGYEWDNDQELGHWLWPVQNPETNAWGYVNFKGQWVIQPTFEDAKLFIKTWNNRAAPAKMDGKWGCIDHTGRYVVTNIYTTSAEAQTAGIRWAEKNKF